MGSGGQRGSRWRFSVWQMADPQFLLAELLKWHSMDRGGSLLHPRALPAWVCSPLFCYTYKGAVELFCLHQHSLQLPVTFATWSGSQQCLCTQDLKFCQRLKGSLCLQLFLRKPPCPLGKIHLTSFWLLRTWACSLSLWYRLTGQWGHEGFGRSQIRVSCQQEKLPSACSSLSPEPTTRI